jgi:hypothetical protein
VSRQDGARARARARAAASHRRLERALAAAMRAADPARALRAAAADPRIEPGVRRALRAADPDGVRLAALLCARLRFERLLRASPEAEAWFDRDPAAFADAFRRYHRRVAPSAFTPADEAAAFRRAALRRQ